MTCPTCHGERTIWDATDDDGEVAPRACPTCTAGDSNTEPRYRLMVMGGYHGKSRVREERRRAAEAGGHRCACECSAVLQQALDAHIEACRTVSTSNNRARLIAAAPSLLEALREIAEADPNDFGSFELAEFQGKARAAIKEATGE